VKGTCQIVVRGKTKTWAFNFPADPKHLPEWEADGLEVYEVCNTIPEWVVDIGLLRLWVRVQDAWKFLRMW
jgi:hypothetical protein